MSSNVSPYRSANLPITLHKRIKLIALEKDSTIIAVISDAIDALQGTSTTHSSQLQACPCGADYGEECGWLDAPSHFQYLAAGGTHVPTPEEWESLH
jgi:hypothetical protein